MAKKVSNYLKLRVLGALEFAEGDSLEARYKAVSRMVFEDEHGYPHSPTWRTIQTWWYRYRRYGVTEPPARSDKGTTRKMPPEELLEAITAVLPGFRPGGPHADTPVSASAVYRACIEAGHFTREQMASSTFRKHVRTFGLLDAKSKAANSKARLAFAKAHANEMWQADTMHGPFLNIGGKPTKTFLVSFIDDASRVVPHGQFYTADSTTYLIDCLQSALFKRGVPQAMYVDNGSNYSSKEFGLVCSRLGIVLLHTPVRDGASKGKIERFFRTVREQFLIRNLNEVTSLEELNRQFIQWVEEQYHTRSHSTLGMRPIDRFGLDRNRLRYLQPTPFYKELFYLEAGRKVRTDNTFNLHGIRYEAPRELRSRSIQVRFDRNDKGAPPIVYHDGERMGEATPVDFVANDRPSPRVNDIDPANPGTP